MRHTPEQLDKLVELLRKDQTYGEPPMNITPTKEEINTSRAIRRILKKAVYNLLFPDKVPDRIREAALATPIKSREKTYELLANFITQMTQDGSVIIRDKNNEMN